MIEKMSNPVGDNEIGNNTQAFGYKAVKRKHVAAILRRSQRKKVSDDLDVRAKKHKKMEDDFQHHSSLGDDLFDALNSSDTELTGDKKNQTIHDIYDGSELKPDSMPRSYPGFTSAEPIPSNPSYKQSEIMFPRMPSLSDELSYEPKKSGNPMDEFLNFNSHRLGRRDKTDDAVNESNDFKMHDDSYLNMVSMLNDNYPKIDLNGIPVDKPIDVVVGLPDNFIVKNYNMADKIDNEKNDVLNENRFNNDFILNDSDFLAGANLMTTKQLNEANSNLITDQVLNLDFSNNNPMYFSKNYPNLRAVGSKLENVNDSSFGNCTTFSLSYGDSSYYFMEEKNYGNFENGCRSIAEKGNPPELSFDENSCLTDLDLNLNKNLASDSEEKFLPSSKINKKIPLNPKNNLDELNDEDEEYSKPFEFKYQSKRVTDCNKENNLHYVRYQHLGDRSIKIWQCGVCGKDFRHQYTLTRHLPTHTDERNYKCETCGKAFRQMSTLSQHRAIHSDARPYVCEFCRKTFNRVSTLISHKKTHSDYKPHKCHICGKAFHQKGNLRNHIFTHTNERPYKCDICSKGFNQMSNLMCHKAHTHSEKGMYPCIRCGQVFNKRFSLRTHEEYVHGIKYPSREVNNEEKKNVRVVQLQNENKNVDQFPKTGKQISVNRSPLQRLKITKTYITDKGIVTEKSMCVGIVIDLIKTKAMESAKQNGQTPFALFKPSSGIPVLVKVLSANGDTQHMLVPATPDDLKLAGKITVAPNSETASVKTVQIKVPVVATVIQSFDETGKMHIEVEPPGPELENQNNELQKDNRKINKQQAEPEIFCEPMESENELGQELMLPPIDSNNVQLLSMDEAKKLFNKKKDMGEGDINKNSNKMENSNKYVGFGTVMSFMSGDESSVDDQNHISSTTDTVDGEELYLITREATKSCKRNESNEFRELPILS